MKKTRLVRLEEMDLETDVYVVVPGEVKKDREGWKGRVLTVFRWIF